MGELSQLKGLGPKSEQALHAIGIHNLQQLTDLGAICVFTRLQAQAGGSISLNFLYALAGAIEDRAWTDIAKNEKDRLLTELAAYQESLHQDEG